MKKIVYLSLLFVGSIGTMSFVSSTQDGHNLCEVVCPGGQYWCCDHVIYEGGHPTQTLHYYDNRN